MPGRSFSKGAEKLFPLSPFEGAVRLGTHRRYPLRALPAGMRYVVLVCGVSPRPLPEALKERKAGMLRVESFICCGCVVSWGYGYEY